MTQSTRDLFRMSEKQFEQIYRQVLASELKTLEVRRKQTFALIGAVLLAAVAVIIFSLRQGLGIFAFIVGLFILVPSLWYIVSRYKRGYKEAIIPSLLKHAGTGLNYTARPKYTVDDVKRSNLFKERISSVYPQDGISGTIDGVTLNVAEIRAIQKSGDDRTTIFDGLFCKADYDERFEGWLWVYPESKIVGDGTLWGNLFASFGSERFESSDRVRVNDGDFESHFRVYGSNPEEVNTILTPKLIDNLLALHQKSDQVALTLEGQTVYVAIWTKSNYLETDIWTPATDRKAIYTKLRDLEKMLSIIEDLNVQYY